MQSALGGSSTTEALSCPTIPAREVAAIILFTVDKTHVTLRALAVTRACDHRLEFFCAETCQSCDAPIRQARIPQNPLARAGSLAPSSGSYIGTSHATPLVHIRVPVYLVRSKIPGSYHLFGLFVLCDQDNGQDTETMRDQNGREEPFMDKSRARKMNDLTYMPAPCSKQTQLTALG